MSRAFVKEDDANTSGEELPERPQSPHPNYVTPAGLTLLQAQLAELQAQRQEQMMHQFAASPQRQGPMPPPGLDPMRRPMSPAGSMAPERAKLLQDISGVVKLMVLGGIIFNILLAVWIYTDIRKRGEGSGIFIALALVAGIPAAIIYALVRISDKKT